MNERSGAVCRISAEYHRFGVTIPIIEHLYARASIDDLVEGLIEEFKLIQSIAGDNELAYDPDYLAMLAGMMGFLECFGKPAVGLGNPFCAGCGMCAESRCAGFSGLGLGMGFRRDH